MAEERGQGDSAVIKRAPNEYAPHQATPASALHEEVERHLLLAALDPRQRESVRAHGWFLFDWPQQVLVLKVHALRTPTVDAYQAPPLHPPLDPVLFEHDDPEALFWHGASWSERVLAAQPRPVYLCSFDVRAARRAVDAPLDFRRVSATPAGMARLVCEAMRRGELDRLLVASDTVRIPELMNAPLDAPWR